MPARRATSLEFRLFHNGLATPDLFLAGRSHRTASSSPPALVRDFPLDGDRLDEVVNSLAAVARDGELPAAAQDRLVFAGA
jgi:hypothetical protein